MNTQIRNVPQINENRYVSTAQAAQALGISVTTVKRWVDDGILPAYKTAGGHRKLLMGDILRVAREGNLPQLDLTKLLPQPQSSNFNDPETVRLQLLSAVNNIDSELIRSLIHRAYLQGFSIEIIADRIISPVLIEVGHAWETGKIEVMHEHRATQAIVSALYELKGHLRSHVSVERPVAVGGAPEHDHYILPSLLAKLVLLDAGWEVIHLGPHTPFSAFKSSINELLPQLVWISVTHLTDPFKFIQEYNSFFRYAESMGVPVAIGGRALNENIRHQLNYTTFGDGLSQLGTFARTLNKIPSLPRRGRPSISHEKFLEKKLNTTESTLDPHFLINHSIHDISTQSNSDNYTIDNNLVCNDQNQVTASADGSSAVINHILKGNTSNKSDVKEDSILSDNSFCRPDVNEIEKKIES